MTKPSNTRIISATATFGAVALMSMISFGSSAEASNNPLRCQRDTPRKVVACCEQMVVKRRPLWMRQTGTSCNSVAISCKFKSVSVDTAATHVAAPRLVKICKIVAVNNDNHNDNEQPDPPDRPDPRGNQTSSAPN